MKGFACTIPGKEVGWIEKPIPSPGPADALLRPIVLAPCTSDIHSAFMSVPPKFMKNRILGHEGIGEIIAIGSEVSDFKVGDFVVVPSVTPDWRKPYVQEKYHQHNQYATGSFKFAFSIDGLFAEYFILPDIDMNGALLPDDIDFEKALMACDMMTTGFHGAELAAIGFGECIAVVGIGPVGLMAVAAAILRGAGRVFAVGTRPNCVALAKKYGATDIISYKEGDIADQILAATGKRGVDKVILAGGDANTFAATIKMLRPGGIMANICNFSEGDILPIPRLAWGAGLGHKQIVGGLCPGGRRRMERMLELIRYGRVDPSLLVSHRFKGLSGIEEGFNAMAEKPADLIKPIVYM